MPNDVSERLSVRAKFFFEGERKLFLKGITYGPFKPDSNGDYVGTPERVRQDLLQMRELGVNTLRLKTTEPFAPLLQRFFEMRRGRRRG